MTSPRSTADVAALIGVTPATIRHYRTDSQPGGRYAAHPFPEPDGHIGISPFWLPERDEEIREWAAKRPGQGAGGGRPSHRPKPE